MTDFGPSIFLAKLWERKSKRGNTYLSGRIGQAQLVIFKSDDVSEDGQAIWHAKIQEAPARKPQASEPAADYQRPANSPLRPAQSSQRGFTDDEIPFGPEWRG